MKGLVFVLAEDFACRSDHLATQALLPIHFPQRSQDALYLHPAQPRTSRHTELSLHVIRRIKQHATCRFTIPSRAAGLLQIILQRARDIGVDDQPHIRLVDSHSESVGCGDRPQFADDEPPLHVLLGLRRQACMVMGNGPILQLQKLGNLFALPACRAIDDGPPATSVGRYDVNI